MSALFAEGEEPRTSPPRGTVPGQETARKEEGGGRGSSDSSDSSVHMESV